MVGRTRHRARSGAARRRRAGRWLAVTVLVAASGPAAALGLGPARVDSQLNERLEAWIPLQDTGAATPGALDAGLAEAGAIAEAEAAALRPAAELRFEIRPAPDGDGLGIRVTSPHPVTEPYLRFLLRVDGDHGRLLREYTLLLDPPTGIAGWEAPEAAGDTPATDTPDAAASDEPAARTYGPVEQGDSAWEIAQATKPPGASVYQAMAGLLRANPDAFPGGDLNRLAAGVTLTLPPARTVTAIPRARAVAIYRRAAGIDADGDARSAAAQDTSGEAAASADAAGTGQAAETATGDATPRLNPIAAARADAPPPPETATPAGADAGGEPSAEPPVARRLAALGRQVQDLRASLENETQRVRATLDAQAQTLATLRSSVEGLDERVGGVREELAASAPARAASPAPVLVGVAALAGGVLGGLAGFAAGRRRRSPAASPEAAPAGATVPRSGDGHPASGDAIAPAEPGTGAGAGPDRPDDSPAADAGDSDRDPPWPPAAGGYAVVSWEDRETRDPEPEREDDARFWADLYIVEGWPLEAVRVLRAAITEDGDCAAYRFGLLEALYHAGAQAEFEAELEQFRRLAPADDRAWPQVHAMTSTMRERAGGDGDPTGTPAPASTEPPRESGDEPSPEPDAEAEAAATVEFEPPDLSDFDDVAPVHGGAPREPAQPGTPDEPTATAPHAGPGTQAPAGGGGDPAHPEDGAPVPELDPLPELDLPDDPAPPAEAGPTTDADGSTTTGADEEIELSSDDDPAILDLTPDDPAGRDDPEATGTNAAPDDDGSDTDAADADRYRRRGRA